MNARKYEKNPENFFVSNGRIKKGMTVAALAFLMGGSTPDRSLHETVDRNTCLSVSGTRAILNFLCVTGEFPPSPDAVTLKDLESIVTIFTVAPDGTFEGSGTGVKIGENMLDTAGHLTPQDTVYSKTLSAVVGTPGFSAPLVGVISAYPNHKYLADKNHTDIATIMTQDGAFNRLPSVQMATNAGKQLRAGDSLVMYSEQLSTVGGYTRMRQADSSIPPLRIPAVIDGIYAGTDPSDPGLGLVITDIGNQTWGASNLVEGGSGGLVATAKREDGLSEGTGVGVAVQGGGWLDLESFEAVTGITVTGLPPSTQEVQIAEIQFIPDTIPGEYKASQ